MAGVQVERGEGGGVILGLRAGAQHARVEPRVGRQRLGVAEGRSSLRASLHAPRNCLWLCLWLSLRPTSRISARRLRRFPRPFFAGRLRSSSPPLVAPTHRPSSSSSSLAPEDSSTASSAATHPSRSPRRNAASNASTMAAAALTSSGERLAKFRSGDGTREPPRPRAPRPRAPRLRPFAGAAFAGIPTLASSSTPVPRGSATAPTMTSRALDAPRCAPSNRSVESPLLRGPGATAAVHGLRDAPRAAETGTRDGRAVNTRTAPPNVPPIPTGHVIPLAAMGSVAKKSEGRKTRDRWFVAERSWRFHVNCEKTENVVVTVYVCNCFGGYWLTSRAILRTARLCERVAAGSGTHAKLSARAAAGWTSTTTRA